MLLNAGEVNAEVNHLLPCLQVLVISHIVLIIMP